MKWAGRMQCSNNKDDVLKGQRQWHRSELGIIRIPEYPYSRNG